MTATLLECKQLQCIRDERILFSCLNFAVVAGDILHVLGPNGVGKTTLLRALTGLLTDYTGDILWQDQPLASVRWQVNATLLFIGHLAGIKNTLTPRENLSFLTNLHTQHHQQAIDHALAQVGLYGYEDMLGYQLSAGQKRRIALARLYLTSAKVWILDEPYTALDVQGIAKLEQLFTQHVANGGCIIMTSHQAPSLPSIKTLSLLDYLPNSCQVAGDVDV